jgi:hypothetical protein
MHFGAQSNEKFVQFLSWSLKLLAVMVDVEVANRWACHRQCLIRSKSAVSIRFWKLWRLHRVGTVCGFQDIRRRSTSTLTVSVYWWWPIVHSGFVAPMKQICPSWTTHHEHHPRFGILTCMVHIFTCPVTTVSFKVLRSLWTWSPHTTIRRTDESSPCSEDWTWSEVGFGCFYQKGCCSHGSLVLAQRGPGDVTSEPLKAYPATCPSLTQGGDTTSYVWITHPASTKIVI